MEVGSCMGKEELEKLAETEQRSKFNAKRLDRLEEKVEDIHEIACSVKEMAMEMKAMREDLSATKNDVKETKDRIEAIEKEPVQNYKEIKSKVVWQVISFILLAILTALGTYIFKWKRRNYNYGNHNSFNNYSSNFSCWRNYKINKNR